MLLWLLTSCAGHCCCDEMVQTYQNFNITWNTTVIGDTVIANCEGIGLTGIILYPDCMHAV